MHKSTKQICAITEHVFLSGIQAVSNKSLLEDHKITHTLNLARELSDLKYPVTLQHCLKVGLRDSSDEDLSPHLNYLVDHIHNTVQAGGNIIVHCVAGVSRSASVCLAYLVKHRGMSLKEAFDFVSKKREGIYPNYGFWKSLVKFEEELRGVSSVQLLPHIVGMVPSVYSQDTEFKIRRYWMNDLCLMFLLHLLMLFVQTLFFFIG